MRARIDFSRPINRKGIQHFLGLAGYFRRFIPHYSESTCPLTELLKKNNKFAWIEQCEKSFLDIKSRLASRPFLRSPNYRLPFVMAVDTSDVATGACMFQVVNGLEHPICYLSKQESLANAKVSARQQCVYEDP